MIVGATGLAVGSHRRRGRPGRHIGAGPSLAMGVDCGLCQRFAAARHDTANLA